MSPAYTTTGSLSSLAALPKVTIVHPEHAPVTYLRASGSIDPGDVVESVAAGHGKTFYEVGGYVQAVASGGALQGPTKGLYGVAMHQVEVMDQNLLDSATVGPIEKVNETIVAGDWVRVLYEGTIGTTKMAAADAPFLPGQLVTWNPAAARGTSLGGNGAFVRTTDKNAALAQVVSFKAIDNSGYAELRLLH